MLLGRAENGLPTTPPPPPWLRHFCTGRTAHETAAEAPWEHVTVAPAAELCFVCVAGTSYATILHVLLRLCPSFVPLIEKVFFRLLKVCGRAVKVSLYLSPLHGVLSAKQIFHSFY
jgi:hypothetical protein